MFPQQPSSPRCPRRLPMLSAPHPAAAGGLQPSGSGSWRPPPMAAWPRHGSGAMGRRQYSGGEGGNHTTPRTQVWVQSKEVQLQPDGAALSTVLCSVRPSHLNAKLQDKNPSAMIFEVVLLLASGEGWEVYQSVSMLIETCLFFGLNQSRSI